MVNKKNILVTGSDGQLGNSIRTISNQYANYNIFFTNKEQLDISQFSLVKKFINENNIKIVINCAAYTNVDLAEKNQDQADLINHISVDNLANICSKKNIQLIHISTDFVFDGLKNSPYNEADIPNPINYYGLSKLKGEKKMMRYKLNKSVIIRTSWLYSHSNNNFVAKIMDKVNNQLDINVVDNQVGSPTNAIDLANLILNLIPKLNNNEVEIYHFSNLGFCTRYDFANKINKIINGKSSISSENVIYTRVKRPKYSVLDSNKLISEFDIKIKNWKNSLTNHLSKIKKTSIYEV